MAKSFERSSVDKVKREARLDVMLRQRKVEERELQNLNRIGWQEIEKDSDEEEAASIS